MCAIPLLLAQTALSLFPLYYVDWATPSGQAVFDADLADLASLG